MGCDRYYFGNALWAIISESSKEGCLCTWPENDEEETLYPERLRSLAMLGAVIVLRQKNLLENKTYYSIPDCLPKWFMAELDRILPLGGDNETR